MVGDESTDEETFSSAEQSVVIPYLQQGGKMFISGSEIAWDLDYQGSSIDKSFIRLGMSLDPRQQIFRTFNIEHSRVVQLSHRKVKSRELRIGKSFLFETRNMVPARANHKVSAKMIIEQKLDQIAAMPVDEQQFAAEEFLNSLNS